MISELLPGSRPESSHVQAVFIDVMVSAMPAATSAPRRAISASQASAAPASTSVSRVRINSSASRAPLTDVVRPGARPLPVHSRQVPLMLHAQREEVGMIDAEFAGETMDLALLG
jgi:hypothetical protein